jgi:hypothetical protein
MIESQEFPNAKLKLSGQSKFCVWRIIAVTLTAAKNKSNPKVKRSTYDL